MPFFPNGCRALLDGWRLLKFVSWHTAQPNSSGSNAVTASGSSRLPIGTVTTGTTGTATNAGAIESAAAAAQWPRITHLSIATARVGGQFHAYAQLGSPVTLALGEKIRIPTGDLDITIPVS